MPRIAAPSATCTASVGSARPSSAPPIAEIDPNFSGKEIVVGSRASMDGSALLAAPIEKLTNCRADDYGFGIHFASRFTRTMSQAVEGTVKPEWQSLHTQTC